MRSFLAIVKLTFRNAIRSHIFQLLLLILILSIILIPNNIIGDGTARGYIQISLKYSIAAIAFVLALSSVWLACYTMTQDVESYQLHMVISKPVSRVTIWLAKWTGINLIHFLLLLVASLAVYFTIIWQFNRQDFSKEEKAKITNEVMVGRRVFYPEFPDINKLAREALQTKLQLTKQQGKEIDESPVAQERMLNDMRREVLSRLSEIPFGSVRVWEYNNLPAELKRPLYLRYRFYVNKIATEAQRLTNGMWEVGVPKLEEEKAKNVFEQAKLKKYEFFLYPLSEYPEQIMCGVFNERVLPPVIIAPDGKAKIAFTNTDAQKSSLFIQRPDGPKILLRVTGFTENYFRAVFVICLELLILSGLGCAAAAVLSMPTAVFVVISYLLFGSFATFMVSTSFLGGAADYIGYYVGKFLLLGVIPMQNFEITHFVANGELIELSLIGNLIVSYFILRAVPLFLIGIWLYWRREMGLVIRK